MALADLDVSDFHGARAHRAPPIAATVSTARAPTDMPIGARTTSTQTTKAIQATASAADLVAVCGCLLVGKPLVTYWDFKGAFLPSWGESLAKSALYRGL
jgi:hypothetical protein